MHIVLRLWFSALFLLSLFLSGQAQRMKADSMRVSMFHGFYALQVPGADLADRFGFSMAAGGGFKIKTKSNWTFGLDGYYFFGNQLKEDSILDGIRDSQGQFVNSYGELAKVLLLERGYSIGIKAGKLFTIKGLNPNSGLLVEVGAGYMAHWIRIENEGNNVPQILKDYTKGYDRLSNGFAASQFIGYSHLASNQRTNFFAGIEVTEGFTQNRRSLNFDTRSRDDLRRLDVLWNLKIGLLIPLYRRTASEYFTY